MARPQLLGFQIRNGEIGADHLAVNSVPTAKILDFNVTTAKLAPKVLTADKVGDAAITGGDQFAATMNADGKTLSGAVTFSSPLTVADATAATHAATKSQLDSAILTVSNAVNSLGNAFNLVANIDGGATAAAAFDLDSLTEKDAGDYYAVTTAGYFESAAQAAFFANVGDGLVFDAAGQMFKIDNTNSTVAGVADFITVTGSADTGFTVDVATTFKDRATALETKVGTVALTTTAANLNAAVNEHDAEIGDVSTMTTMATTIAAAIAELNAQTVISTWKRETPAGTIDGVNKVFTIAFTPIEATVQIFFNGQLREPIDDYTISGTTLTFVEAPAANYEIRAIYFKAA